MKTMNAAGTPLLKLPEVLALFPVSRAGWYQGVKVGRYPAPVKLGARSVAWRRADVEKLIAELGHGDAQH
ncbi:helix-turn-helix transcriptional regulator [Sphaerotilus hippei]|uniref:helix-turn-helix transcriptional regulator n=1 Tax=Sphaerotilus hippei TaxID=744406 RepID=UPI001FE6937A|nr:AlpA family phage regulatory protein [Sphaerotilus hippei]